MVTDIEERSPAEEGGVAEGDVIMSINGIETDASSDLVALMPPLTEVFYLQAKPTPHRAARTAPSRPTRPARQHHPTSPQPRPYPTSHSTQLNSVQSHPN